ncbi:RNA polymerase sigma factor [Holdemanella porci]|uniref:RNA polymerase sigma factor n=1 Tax=Holdemanella porci TaxID=2652276 RepID=UPI003F935EBC
MNFEKLLRIVPSTEEGEMPKAASLSESPVVFTKEYGGAVITVHENGYYTFEYEEHTTVYSVHRCADYVDPSDSSGKKIDAEKVKDLDWYLPLAMFGFSRIEHIINSNTREHEPFSLNNDGSDYSGSSPSTEEILAKKEEEREYQEKWNKRKAARKYVMSTLTKRQRYCLMESYFGNKTEAQIAKELGCSQQNVHIHISAGLKKAKKAFDKLGIL